MFKDRLTINIGKKLQVFLDLSAGVLKKPTSDTEPGPNADDAARPAQQRPRVEPTAKATHKPSRAAKSATAREARDHVRKNYGHAGLPTVDILDVLPGIDETVSVGRSSDALAPAAVALVKGLAARIPGSRVLQLETAPRTSIAANVVRTSRECLSIIAEDREPGARARGESLLVERASYDATSGEVSYHSTSLDYAGIKRGFDLVVVDGRGSPESVHDATEMAFDLLKPGVESAIVWNVRQTDSGQIAWEVLAGILDGAPDDGYDDLYFVPGTSQVLWTHRDLLKTRDSIRPGPKDVVDVRYAVRSAPRKLVVLDDGFPSRRSAFRIAEYNNYLERWNDATLYSTTSSFTALGEKKHFSEVLNVYAALYPSLAGRVFKYNRDLDLGGDLAYFVFLNNAMRFLAGIEESGSPFAFTLYPGGGFRLHQKDSDDNLRRVCSSPSFRKVIATQKVTYDYLVDGEFCRPEDVEFVYGGVFPFSDAVSQAVPRRHYKRDKDTFDVCFVAYKYTVRSLKSKGYDVFAEVARQLSKVHEDVRFHVVGTFDETDVDVSEVGDKVRFYGPRTTEFFPAFYANMDAIISPNASFALQPGAFDGFPTGSCMEAGMCGVAVFCSDPLRQNVAFKDGEEMVIIPRDAHEICSSLSYYRENYERLRALADRGQQAFTRVFDIEAQMRPRLRIISELLGESDATRR